MTLACERASDLADASLREQWMREFVACGPQLRTGQPHATHAPSTDYTGLILRLAGLRPYELFMIRKAGVIRGRAMVASSLGKPTAAAMGLFEVCDQGDLEAGMLIAAAEDWAKGAGHTEIFAPVDLNTWFTYRFLLPSGPSGAPPVYGWEPAQPPAYRQYFETLGYREVERYQTRGGAFDPAIGYDVADAARMTAPALDVAIAAGNTFFRLDAPERLEPLLVEMHPICMGAFSKNLLFEPLPVDIFSRLYLQVAARADCSLSHWVRDRDGMLVGFVLVMMDEGAVVVKTIAVAEDRRGQRLSTALMHLVLKVAGERGHRRFVSALVRSGNTSAFLFQAHAVPGMTTWDREYVLLHRTLGAS